MLGNAEQNVVPPAAGQDVGPIATDQRVVAASAIDARRRCNGGGDLVAARPHQHGLVFGRGSEHPGVACAHVEYHVLLLRRLIQCVDPIAAVRHIGAIARDHRVIASPADNGGAPGTAHQHIRAVAALQRVISDSAVQTVIARIPDSKSLPPKPVRVSLPSPPEIALAAALPAMWVVVASPMILSAQSDVDRFG